MRILVDGWPLIHAAGSPASLHLAAFLDTLPTDIEAVLALPGHNSCLDTLPDMLEVIFHEIAGTNWGLLRWQQIVLPQFINSKGIDLIYTTHPSASILGRVNTLSSPAVWSMGGYQPLPDLREKKGLRIRIQEAFGMGGLAQAKGVFWPKDLPLPNISLPFIQIPPLIHPLFQSNQPTPAVEFWPEVNFPETYILYHGPLDRNSFERLLEAWSWAATSIGTYYPLIVYGATGPDLLRITSTTQQVGLEDSLLFLPPGSPVQLAALYKGTSALFQPGPISPWGDPIRHAMACAKPIIAAASKWSDALIGSAGFLLPPEDLRGLGAALITVIVEDELAERLSIEAELLAKVWFADEYWKSLLNFVKA